MEPKSSVTLPVEHKDVTGVQLPDGYAPQKPVGAVESCTKSCTADVKPSLPVVIPVRLTRGYHALVSEQDYERVAAIKWRVKVDPDGRAYAVAHRPGSGKHGKSILMHRFVLGITDSNIKVDHANGLTLCNWRENLRPATNAENISNQRPHRDKRTSKLKGVCLNRRNGKFRAQIERHYHKINLGDFPTELDAARAYDAKARELFGPFARCNFPEPNALAPQAGGAA
jgi:hypothetical protein